jgi:transcriptional regulator
MYVPPAFREDDPEALKAMIRQARLAQLVTATAEGLHATPLPLFLAPEEGPHGTLYGHLARANPQWRLAPSCDALALFSGPDAYVSPSWYPSKQEHHRVVPTWNYVAVHAYGPVEFFDDAERMHAIVSKLTDMHEKPRAAPWAVTDAPEDFVRAQLRGIVGLRLPIQRIEGKRKMSQNRSEADRRGVAAGLADSELPGERAAARLIPI